RIEGAKRRSNLFRPSLANVRLEPAVGIKHFLLVIWIALVENNVTNHHQKLLSLAGKPARERMLTGDIDKTLAHPLPKLLLSRPKLIVVCAHNTRSLFRTSLCRRCFHRFTTCDSKHAFDLRADVSRALHNPDPRSFHCRHLFGRSPLPSGY